jgi:hypothetical protein
VTRRPACHINIFLAHPHRHAEGGGGLPLALRAVAAVERQRRSFELVADLAALAAAADRKCWQCHLLHAFGSVSV